MRDLKKDFCQKEYTGINLDQIYLDRLNPPGGVLQSFKRGLARYHPTNLKLLLYKSSNPARYLEYSRQLKQKAFDIASRFNLADKLTFCF